ncbi:TRAP transporter small permease [Aquibacillus sp. 3ASR75-11]|uniref:TRAP transporter small permease n=1 Tax=Terrihalobacillus insolitus TaxID=2950438 RepID=A0A9X4AKF5_9BACI|nr:TRAP transporter small permease [Terrihalobacillus insolitus]MDC3412060.1 TRAP transporter small permease [Terrihalobacillus insolitus]MDC3423247.1 TRAP transporter small permease [Terrihalobacillus insolitus]
MQVVNGLIRILKFLTTITFSMMAIVVLIQILGRYLPFTFVWTEELTRYLFVYAIAFGAPVAMERRGYMRVDILVNLLPLKIQKYYDAFIYLVLGVFSTMLVLYSYDFAMLGQGQTSATLKINMVYIFASMIVAFTFTAFYSFINIYNILTGKVAVKEEGIEI